MLTFHLYTFYEGDSTDVPVIIADTVEVETPAPETTPTIENVATEARTADNELANRLTAIETSVNTKLDSLNDRIDAWLNSQNPSNLNPNVENQEGQQEAEIIPVEAPPMVIQDQPKKKKGILLGHPKKHYRE